MTNRTTRSSSSKRSIKIDEYDSDSDYVQVYVKPLKPSDRGFLVLLTWIASSLFPAFKNNRKIVVVFGTSLCAAAFYGIYQLSYYSVEYLMKKICSFTIPAFCIMCLFYWLAFILRNTWTNISIYLFFLSCYVSETLTLVLLKTSYTDSAQPFKNYKIDNLSESQSKIDLFGLPVISNESDFIHKPLVVLCFMLSISMASVFLSLDVIHSAIVIISTNFVRFLACNSLVLLPEIFRPYLAYTSAFVGVLVSKYMETMMATPLNETLSNEGKIPVMKRRRSSSGSHNVSSQRLNRRTSLPAITFCSQNAVASYDSAVINEAHGLITDMLAETDLPPRVVSGLKAISNILQPTENHLNSYRPRVSPLVSLTESSFYGSDTEDSPYTGERPNSLPKRLRRSIPPSLLRRMSTSTWTTTTSATGMPTVELEPCRLRSSSFRHQRGPDNITPGSSPAASRSNSPSPSSPSTVNLSIPKPRSFSVSTSSLAQPGSQRRQIRKNVCFANQNDNGHSQHQSCGLHSSDHSSSTTGQDLYYLTRNKFRNVTSDYESSDSLSNSDHNECVTSSDKLGSPDKTSHLVPNSIGHNQELMESEQSNSKLDSLSSSNLKLTEHCPVAVSISSATPTSDNDPIKEVHSDVVLPFTGADVDGCALLESHRLAEWDYPIFDLSSILDSCVLSKLAYKLFSEVNLMETFRIPLTPFILFFHALEMGYRNIPYHNRIHAADVLHGVYFFTTQPVPGLQHTNFDLLSSSQTSNQLDCERQMVFKSMCTDDSYGIMGCNFPPLELMALYTAAAMHDYDHPARTNAFLVTTYSPQAILYNDRSVLENHHAASAWSLFMSSPKFNFLSGLDAAEFKRFRFLVIEAILATDLKRHFEILTEFNAKVNDDDAPGLDWTQETDRLLVSQMVIKLVDINGPTKSRDLHCNWTRRISEEFYEQGAEEMVLNLPISPFMDRRNPQLAKLQESFINHLVAPLCNAMVTGGIVPGTWVDSDEDKEYQTASEVDDECNDVDNALSDLSPSRPKPRQVNCVLTKNMKENHEMWVAQLRETETQTQPVDAPSTPTSGNMASSPDKEVTSEGAPRTEN